MKNKTALITGASKGIGYATAKLFGENGYNVILTYNTDEHSAKELEHYINLLGVRALAVKVDMAKTADIISLFEVASREFGSVEAVVNNAGIAHSRLFTDLTDDEIDNMLNINLRSVIICCREAVKLMIKKSGGSIVNISSIFGIEGAATEVHYSAAKAGVIGLTKALACETARSGIRVNCVAPGAVLTPMNEHLSAETIELIKEETPMGRLGTADEMAQLIYFVSSENASYITGQVLSANGGSVR